MGAPLDDETKEIIVSFIEEGYERLDDAENQLSKLEESEDKTAKLNSVFRLFHSVKGSAGYLGFDHIKRLTHVAETLLDAFLKEHYEATPDSIDAVFRTIDVLRGLIATVEKTWSDSDGESAAHAQADAIEGVIATLKGAPVPAAEPNGAAAMPNEVRLTSLVSRDMVERFIGECADTVDATERIALSLENGKVETEKVNDIFRAVHTSRAIPGFSAISCSKARAWKWKACWTTRESRRRPLPSPLPTRLSNS